MLLIVVLGGVVWWPFATHMIFEFSDFWFHIDEAQRMLTERRILEPHFLFHGLAIGLHLLVSQWSLETAGFVTLAGALTAAVVAAYLIVSSGAPAMPPWRHAATFVVLAYAVVLAGPVHVSAVSPHLAAGYVVANSYHNPTIVVLKPLALALFALVAGVRVRPATDVGRILAIAFFVVVSALAKPHYVVCLVPAAVVLAVWDRLRGAPTRWSVLVGVLPAAAAVLGWQYWIGRATRFRAGVEWAPFAFMSQYSDRIGPKFVLSIAFPLAVLCTLRRARADRALLLAWLAFGFGCARRTCWPSLAPASSTATSCGPPRSPARSSTSPP